MERQEKVRFKIRPRLLDNIGLAMYSSIPKAISELIANSYDADATEVHVDMVLKSGLIERIVIRDNGDGMSSQDIKNVYLALGYDKRKKANSTSRLKRKLIGNKGIGKLAGLGIAERMEVISFSKKEKTILDISRKYFEKGSLDLSKIEFPLRIANLSDGTQKGTEVHLSNLLEHANNVDASELRRFLSKEFGFAKKFRIYVDGQKLSADDIKGKRIIIKDNIDGLGVVEGKIIIADTPGDVKKPGIITYVRGRAIEGPTLYDINTPSHNYMVANRIFGELNADFLDPDRQMSLLDNFIISTSRDGFNRSHPKYMKYRAWVEKTLISIAKQLEARKTSERLDKLHKNPTVQAILKDLPKPFRAKFENTIKLLIPKLNNLPDDQANNLLEFITRLAETECMLQILEKIKDADEKDLEILSELLEEWGIYEITALSRLIKNRLDVIEKLERMINDTSAKEFPDMHRILEKNLWILNDSYELYSSNRQLGVILGEKIKRKYLKAKGKRPDLICKSLLNNYLVLELKRPKYKITFDDYPQVIEYSTILKDGFPNSLKLDCYLIGKEYESGMSKEPTLQGAVTIYLKSYSEIIEEAKQRYKEVLEIFKRDMKNG